MRVKAVLLSLLFLSGVVIPAPRQTAPSAKDQGTKDQGATDQGTKDQIELHSRMAQQYLTQRRPDLAIPELEKVVALDPKNADANGNFGVLMFFRGDYKDAIPHLRAAMEMKPDLSKIQGLLGLAEVQLGNRGTSRADLEAAFPHLTEEKFQLEVGRALIDNYTATDDLDKAAATVSALLVSRPTDVSLLYMSYRIHSDLAGRAMLTLALTAPGSFIIQRSGGFQPGTDFQMSESRHLGHLNDNCPKSPFLLDYFPRAVFAILILGRRPHRAVPFRRRCSLA